MTRQTINVSDVSQQIRKEIAEISAQAYKQHKWLLHQDLIGLSIFSISIVAILLNMYLYFSGVLSAWIIIPLSAFWMSLLHELEHDLIHWLYFRNNKFMHHLLLLGVFIFRPTTLNPWFRRAIHFRHHKMSGTETDLEERAITNGEPWGIRRFLMMGDNVLSFMLRPRFVIKEVLRCYRAGKISREEWINFNLILSFGYFPLGIMVYAIWYGFLIFWLANSIAFILDVEIIWPALLLQQMPWINFLIVTLIAPNILRTFCIHFISSNMHYYGDIESGDVTKQCQVLNVWWLWPMQLFCFNFGNSHAIHHFYTQAPFYLREMTTKQAHKILKRYGVRFNDLGSFLRANRYNLVSTG